MLLLLVQGKLTNLTVEERIAFNVSLRMFTRSIVIQRRVEDLQLGVKSYQKKLNLTKLDTYRSDLKQREAYSAYSNPRGFIYHNKDKKNRLMRIDELHKFSDGTLNDVRTTLNDHLKGIQMKYLPQTIWRQSNRDKVAAMIQAIDKQLKTRRIMRSLEKFIGGRPYEDKMDSMHSTLSMYYDYDAHVKGEILVMMKNSQRNIMDEVDIEDLTIEQYLRLTQENQTPKKIENMTIADKCAPTHDSIREFAHYFGPNQPDAESDCDSEDMEKEVEYMTNDEVVMSEQEISNHGNTQNIQHFKEKDDVDKWLNVKITKHLSIQGVENTEDALINIIKSIKKEMKDDIMKKKIEVSIDNIDNETSSIASSKVDIGDDNTSPTASFQLPKELSLGSFLLPFNIDDHNLYAITILEAKDNIMPLDVYKYLGLDKLRDAETIENTTGTNEPLAAIDILVKFETLEFLCNFVIKMADDVIILGRPFLESTHAQIDVFNEEISFEIGNEKFKFDINSHQCIDFFYMVDMEHEEETFNPLEIGIALFSYESPACLKFKQRSRNSKDCRMWPTCDLDLKFCFGYNEVFGVNKQGGLRMWICFRDHERRTVKGSYMGFADFLQVRYGQQKIDDTTRERRYYEWVAQNYEFSKHRTLTSTTLNDHFPYDTNNPIPKEHLEQEENEQLPIRPRPCNYSFEEWLKIRIGHNNLHESDREFIFNEWILDSYDVEEEYAREIGDPYSRRFDEYNRVFKNEIEHLSNEYILRIGREVVCLDDVWEKMSTIQ
ncbi:reverse transcriptase domain-containing protein [Tanacetum coccineum]